MKLSILNFIFLYITKKGPLKFTNSSYNKSLTPLLRSFKRKHIFKYSQPGLSPLVLEGWGYFGLSHKRSLYSLNRTNDTR